MKFLIRTKGCTLRDHIGKEDIRAELNILSMNNRINQSSLKWKQHVERMNGARLVNQAVNNKPRGRRDVRRPGKRWLK